MKLQRDDTNYHIYQNLQNCKLAKSQYLEGSPISDKGDDDDDNEKVDIKMEMKMELSSISDNNEKTQNPIENSLFKLNNQIKDDPESLKSQLKYIRDQDFKIDQLKVYYDLYQQLCQFFELDSN